jgi:hypothetical protein
MKDHRLLDGVAVRDRILDEIADRVREASAAHVIGRLVSISIGEHKEVAVYVRGQARAAERAGLSFEEQIWPDNLPQDAAKSRLVAMNDDPEVLGMILQRPIPKHRSLRPLPRHRARPRQRAGHHLLQVGWGLDRRPGCGDSRLRASHGLSAGARAPISHAL